MKIYTKKGDKGQTSLLGGKKVAKSNIRIDAYGTIDELNSFIGLLRDQNIDAYDKKILIKIQNNLFTIGSNLALSPEKANLKIPEIKEENIIFLEKEIDKISKHLPEMRNFVLPGGNKIISLCHICRTVCRRAERKIVSLYEQEQINEIILKYLNRLSDYLFILARKFNKDLQVKEEIWKP